jgi:hypothetical protein
MLTGRWILMEASCFAMLLAMMTDDSSRAVLITVLTMNQDVPTGNLEGYLLRQSGPTMITTA